MNKKLLFTITKKDFDVNWFSGTGGGGQHRNKHQNCVRLLHRESGASATGQRSRSRDENLKEAIHNLVKTGKFKVWHSKKVQEIRQKKSIEQILDEMMAPENLKVEMRNEDDTKWVDWKD